jgi:hypothetical protein
LRVALYSAFRKCVDGPFIGDVFRKITDAADQQRFRQLSCFRGNNAERLPILNKTAIPRLFEAIRIVEVAGKYA